MHCFVPSRLFWGDKQIEVWLQHAKMTSRWASSGSPPVLVKFADSQFVHYSVGVFESGPFPFLGASKGHQEVATFEGD